MKGQYEIHDRIFTFVVLVIKFVNKLPRTNTQIIINNQLTRSVTSMGANDQEADGAFSKKDFIHCYVIVRKETKESVFWLRVIKETVSESYSAEAESLIAEGKEIAAIVSTIIKKSSI